MARGPFIPATVICLHRPILGDGCLTATETGCSCPLWVGCGSPEGLTTGSAYRVMRARCRSISILWLRLRRAPQRPLLSEEAEPGLGFNVFAHGGQRGLGRFGDRTWFSGESPQPESPGVAKSGFAAVQPAPQFSKTSARAPAMSSSMPLQDTSSSSSSMSSSSSAHSNISAGHASSGAAGHR